MSMKPPHPSPTQLPDPSAPPQPAKAACPPFDPARMRRELWLDSASRWAMTILLVLAILLFQAGMGAAAFWLLMVPVVVLWVAISTPSARTTQALPQISLLLDHDLSAAEAGIAQGLARRPLHRQLRLQLYHRLALLRHYQSRLDESFAIARALLDQPLGAAERHRPQLLLILVESSLLRNDLASAYSGLADLSRLPLGLVESLQHLALRTRYEVASGYPMQALAGLPGKMEYARMLPAWQCGEMHLLMAVAARQVDDQPLHHWLLRRAELLCEPARLAQFHQGRLAFEVEKPLTLAPL